MKRSLLSRYLPAFILILAGTVIIFALFMNRRMSTTLMGMYSENLSRTAELMEIVLAAQCDDPHFEDMNARFAAAETSTRLTIILPDGTVAADSHYDVARLDNHADRPEIKKAFRGTPAYSDRWSDTLRMEMLYYALPVTLDGKIAYVIRTSMPIKDISAVKRAVGSGVVITGLIVLLTASLFSWLVHRKTSIPLQQISEAIHHYATGELEYPLHIDGPPGIRSLSNDVQAMAAELIRRINLVTRQRNELEAIFSSMIEAVVVLNENMVIKAINPAAARLAGLTRDGCLGKRFIEVFRNSELEQFTLALLNNTEPAETEISFSMPLASEKSSNGISRERSLQVHGSLFRTAKIETSEEPVHSRLLLVLHDISELKRLEQIRKDFVANVSHELRTPITSLKGYVETLLDGAVDDKETAVNFLNIIASQTERINAIVADLLSLSRLEQAGNSLETEPVPIRGLAESAIRVCRRKAEEKNISVDLTCPEGLMVEANSLLIEQALVNLVDNAVKYSDSNDPVRLIIETSEDSVVIRVEDQGCGIPEKDIPRLFERFYRVDKARSRELGGTGLGLSIVKHIALAHNGSVDVHSIEGRGSVFVLRLPLSAED